MAQAVLSAASALQAKSDSLRGGPVSVGLDNPCQAGSTVTVEVYGSGADITAPLGYAGSIPDGFELDGCTVPSGGTAKFLQGFRKREVAAGEQSWSFNSPSAPLNWVWRVTEWGADLEPISPLEGFSGSYGINVGQPATFSTGTAPPTGNTGRPNVVALAWHLFSQAQAAGGTAGWTGHTNGFAERAALATVLGGFNIWSSWSWTFAEAVGQFETTAAHNRSVDDSTSNYATLLTVYAATTYA